MIRRCTSKKRGSTTFDLSLQLSPRGDERCGLGSPCHIARPDIGRGRDALLRDPAWHVPTPFSLSPNTSEDIPISRLSWRDRSSIAVARFLDMPRRIAQERVPTARSALAREKGVVRRCRWSVILAFILRFLRSETLLVERFAYIQPGIGISAIPKMGTAHSLFALFGTILICNNLYGRKLQELDVGWHPICF